MLIKKGLMDERQYSNMIILLINKYIHMPINIPIAKIYTGSCFNCNTMVYIFYDLDIITNKTSNNSCKNSQLYGRHLEIMHIS